MSTFSELEHAESLLSTLDIPYFYIGGWGIDLFLGRVSRSHSDIEVTIYRKDQDKLHDWALSSQLTQFGYTLHVVDPPGTANTPIWEGGYLENPIHQLQIYKLDNLGDIQDRVLDIMLSDLDPNDLDKWQFRRDRSISANRSQIEQYTSEKIPYHVPEVLLLYKCKRNEKKDQQDRNLAWNQMTGKSKQWLIDTLAQLDPDHPWLNELLPL